MTTSTKLRDRPVFICGHPKSGTSLLRNLLDSHPQLVVYPEETGFFRRFLKEAAKLDLESQLDLAEKQILHIFEWNQNDPPPHQAGFPDRDYSAISFEKVVSAMRKYVKQAPVRCPGDILSASVLAFGDVSGQVSSNTKRWVEKSPYNERFAQRIFSWWPDALCIHIVRDPRDNFVSYFRKQQSWTPEYFTNFWVKSTQTGLNNQEQYGLKRYWIVCYEDIVQDLPLFIRNICEFLGIDEHPNLYTPSHTGMAWSGNSMFEDSFEGVDSSSIGRWKEKLSGLEISVIETMAGELMQYLGYVPQGKRSLKANIRVSLWRGKLFLYRKFRKRKKKFEFWYPF